MKCWSSPRFPPVRRYACSPGGIDGFGNLCARAGTDGWASGRRFGSTANDHGRQNEAVSHRPAAAHHADASLIDDGTAHVESSDEYAGGVVARADQAEGCVDVLK